MGRKTEMARKTKVAKIRKNRNRHVIVWFFMAMLIIVLFFSLSPTHESPSYHFHASHQKLYQSITPVQTAFEPPNVPTTIVDKTYYKCLKVSYIMTSTACKKAEIIVSKEKNIFGSNMSQKFKYQISESNINNLKALFIIDLNANKMIFNNIDYFTKKGVNKIPKNAYATIPTGYGHVQTRDAMKVLIPEEITLYIYDSLKTRKDFCASITSFDGKLTWKSSLTVSNYRLGTPCSITSLE